jgi:TonB family protein
MTKVFLAFVFVFAGVIVHAQQAPPDSSGVFGNDSIGEVDAPPEVYVYVEVMAEFPGGKDAMMKFLSENIKYPTRARDKNIQGKVIVQFVVNEDGSISDAQVLHDIGEGCGAEVLRVVSLMPKWNPGSQAGETVKVRFNLPVGFYLDNTKKDKSKKKQTDKDNLLN